MYMNESWIYEWDIAFVSATNGHLMTKITYLIAYKRPARREIYGP